MKSPIQCKSSSSTSTTLLSVVIFFTTLIVVAADDADYMSRLLKALTPTPPGWSNKTHFCEWNGVVCHQSSTLVHTISLPSTSLTGTLPPLLYNHLSNLTNIDLHNNSLSGPLPDLFRLQYLKTVNLGHNNFTSIPNGCFLVLTTLQTLNLSNNLNLNPELFPDDLSSSSLLNTLDLEATNIIDSLPSEMLDWFPRLETLVLSHNNISGPLPHSLATSAVKCLKVNNQGTNGFTGTIEVISSMKHLTQAWLNNNSFRGPIPDLSNLTNLFDLQLHNNQFYGVVPSSLMALSSLKTVSLDDNIFQGPIPVFNNGLNVKATWEGNHFWSEPFNPQVLNLLEITTTFEYPFFIWSGSDPCNGENFNSIGCTKDGKIRSADFSNSDITGTISPAFANLTNLVNLTLSGNNFMGIIPDTLTTLSQLRFLDVSNNNLSGQVPKFSSKVKLNITGNVLLRLSDPVDNKTVPADGTIKTKREAQVSTSLKPLWKALIGASAFSVGVIIPIMIICKHKGCLALVNQRMFKKTFLDDNVEDFIKSYNLSLPKRYTYGEVKTITNSFRDKLGQGGYGVVYKASLSDGCQVAHGIKGRWGTIHR